ncbi:hypothetical protein THAOC_20187 [Thalassiosira oceanica]|uniref:Uncharacterized protein n=1 Tax=Thalassiosira oceanica TaxID=159749 RepID=K0S3Y9_THAOC|nr:hypothetical protein THAOC_20187 [Thalassiosira oceanica]|eukprot:EJK59564.1 hypothetical protein THAOC_20187 [Thalassiosira oceanica]
MSVAFVWASDQSGKAPMCAYLLHGMPQRVETKACLWTSRGRATQTLPTLSRPLKEKRAGAELCPFKFAVHFDPHLRRWFVPLQQRGSVMHIGHHKELPTNIRLQSRHLGNPLEREILNDSLRVDVATVSANTLFNERAGSLLEPHQLAYLRKKQQSSDLLIGGSVKSHADRLEHNLLNDPSKSSIFVYAEQESGLLRIRVRKQHMNSSMSTEELSVDLGDKTETPLSFAESVRGQMKSSETGKVLLLAAWTSDESRRNFDMFPEFVGGDDTEQTNSEERPLFSLLGKDNNNKSFTIMNAFMPSKAEWAYTFLMTIALSFLHPGTALKRVQLLICDADRQETSAFNKAAGRGLDFSKVCPNAFVATCAWHRIDRNLLSHNDFFSLLKTVRDSGIENRAEIDAITRWLWYFIKHYETIEECNVAMKFLKFYLAEVDQSKRFGTIDNQELRMKLREWVTEKFDNKREELFGAFFGGMTLGNCTTSINESYHRVVKKSAQGVNPKQGIDRTQNRLDNLREISDANKSKQVAFHASSAPAKQSDRDRDVAALTTYCSKRLFQHYGRRHDHKYYHLSKDEFYVKVDSDSGHEVDLDLPRGVCKKLFDEFDVGEVSKSERRKMDKMKDKLLGVDKSVKIVHLGGGEFCLVCSCPVFRKFGHACSCVYALLDRKPSINDALVRWHSGFTHFYGRPGLSQNISDHYLRMRDEVQMPGVILTSEEVVKLRGLPIGEGNESLAFFQRSRGTFLLRGKDTYWHTVRDRLPKDLQTCIPCNHSDNIHDDEILDLDSVGNPSSVECVQGVVESSLMGATNEVRTSSTYQVPSQKSIQTNNNDAGSGLGGDYMHIYQQCAKLADGLKQFGSETILRDALHKARNELMALADEHGQRESFCKAKVAKRLVSDCSNSEREGTGGAVGAGGRWKLALDERRRRHRRHGSSSSASRQLSRAPRQLAARQTPRACMGMLPYLFLCRVPRLRILAMLCDSQAGPRPGRDKVDSLSSEGSTILVDLQAGAGERVGRKACPQKKSERQPFPGPDIESLRRPSLSVTLRNVKTQKLPHMKKRPLQQSSLQSETTSAERETSALGPGKLEAEANIIAHAYAYAVGPPGAAACAKAATATDPFGGREAAKMAPYLIGAAYVIDGPFDKNSSVVLTLAIRGWVENTWVKFEQMI